MRDQTIPRAPLRGARKDPIGVFCSTRLSIDDQMLKKMRSGGVPHYRSKHRAYAVTTRVLPPSVGTRRIHSAISSESVCA